MRQVLISTALLLIPAAAVAQGTTLTQAKQGFKTKLKKKVDDKEQLKVPNGLFTTVRYPSAIGELQGVVSRPRDPKRKHPAIVWLTGGFPGGGISKGAWERVDSKNDQGAKVYRLSGIVMMYPTLRGTYGNPRYQEAFLGEVDDVIAAAKYLAKLPYVDPNRIYLGGHSTGGTLALLVAESTSMFKGVFSFGPVCNPLADYGPKYLPFDTSNPKEAELRSPIRYLDQITSPTWVIEGSRRGNAGSIHKIRLTSKNPKVKAMVVRGANHFDILAPVNALIARSITKGEALSKRSIQSAYTQHRIAQREGNDLSTLGSLRRSGLKLDVEVTARHYVAAFERKRLDRVAADLKALPGGYGLESVKERKGRYRKYYLLVVTRTMKLSDLETVFATSRAIVTAAEKHDAIYDGWDAK